MAPPNETAKMNPQFIQQGYSPPSGTFDPRLFSNQPYPVIHIQQYNPPANRRPTCVRFFRAFAVAALVWLLCSMFLSSFLSMVHYRPWAGRPGDYPIPPQVTLEQCVSYDDWSSRPADYLEASQQGFSFPLIAVTTLDLPLSAEALLVLSRGPMSAGSVEIVTSPQQGQDVATVEVAVSYFREVIRDQAKVCRILRKDRAVGVGIFTPEWPHWRGPQDRLYFATKVILPEASPESSPLLIKKFETDVANTIHRVGDLNKKVLFQSLLLKGSNARIDIESVQADLGIIGTSNAAIRGIFNTSASLSLITSNGQIEADVGLSSINASEPKLSLSTSNGAVTSRISLISDTGLGGSFKAGAVTSNGRLDVDFPAAPPYSLLTFGGTTSNARAVVSLNPAYEGSFILSTSLSTPLINQDRSVIDPSGRNRERSLNIRKAGRVISGEVFWDDATEDSNLKPAGLVSIRSSNARVELDL
ncbi:hypothetical protein BYT27DRAFT_7172708 [Phlegmacium glaucopus]|nr:hypothetical protein BYT27DRAFT_7172708 [Phlegmacium glaucopus]